jgi:putative PIN family toxin of toxin-antitoxin system
MHHVVFDTNVLFSAIGWDGTPGRCVELVQHGRVRGLTCPEILDELGDKLSVKLGYDEEKIAAILASLISFFDLTAISGTLIGSQPDRSDDKIIECSLVAKATHIVTGDRKHLLPLKRVGDVEIVTPAEMIQLVDQVRL